MPSLPAVRYIGTGVALSAAFKFSPFRSQARTILAGDFRAHSSVLTEVEDLKHRRRDLYRAVTKEILDHDEPGYWTGKKPEDLKGCFTAGGGVHTTTDDLLLRETYDGILAEIGMSEGTTFSVATADRFRKTVQRTIYSNRTQLWWLSLLLRRSERLFELEGDAQAGKLVQLLKGVVPGGGVHKAEIKRLACSVVHAVSESRNAMFVTTEDALIRADTHEKVMGQISKVLKLPRDACPGLEHLGDVY